MQHLADFGVAAGEAIHGFRLPDFDQSSPKTVSFGKLNLSNPQNTTKIAV